MKKFSFKIQQKLIITLLISLIIIFFKNQFSPLLLAQSTYGMPALIKQGNIDNLYLGSSMFRQGLDITELDSSSDSSNYILAYNGNQPCLEYYQLKYLLDNNLDIKNLYIDLYVYSAWEHPQLSDEKMLMEFPLSEKWDIWKLLYNHIPSKPQAFWKMFVTANNELMLSWLINSPLVNTQFQSGGTLTATSALPPDALNALPSPDISDHMDSLQAYYLKKIISLAKNNNINLIFLETPKYSKLAADSDYLNGMQEYISILSTSGIPIIVCNYTYEHLQAISPNYKNNHITFYDFDNKNSNYYMDLLHLSSEGRKAFTQIIN